MTHDRPIIDVELFFRPLAGGTSCTGYRLRLRPDGFNYDYVTTAFYFTLESPLGEVFASRICNLSDGQWVTHLLEHPIRGALQVIVGGGAQLGTVHYRSDDSYSKPPLFEYRPSPQQKEILMPPPTLSSLLNDKDPQVDPLDGVKHAERSKQHAARKEQLENLLRQAIGGLNEDAQRVIMQYVTADVDKQQVVIRAPKHKKIRYRAQSIFFGSYYPKHYCVGSLMFGEMHTTLAQALVAADKRVRYK